MFTRLSIIFGLCLSFPIVGQAKISDLTCDDSGRIKRMLTEDMQAERRGAGLRDPDTVLEVWVTPKRGDWTIVQNYANGTSCIVAMGEYWEGAAAQPVKAETSSNRSIAGAGCTDSADNCE